MSAHTHRCKKEGVACKMCLRPDIENVLYKNLSPNVQANFCVKTSDVDGIDVKDITCKFCKKVGRTSLCFELHKRYKCKNMVVCDECKKSFRLVGKYSLDVRKKKPNKHDTCEEVFCHTCNDYVVGFENPRSPSHVCYVQPVTSAKPWPSLIAAFDLETFPCDEGGNMTVNMAHMITQESRNCPDSDFVGVFFTDVPMESVSLNGQEVSPGKKEMTSKVFLNESVVKKGRLRPNRNRKLRLKKLLTSLLVNFRSRI